MLRTSLCVRSSRVKEAVMTVMPVAGSMPGDSEGRHSALSAARAGARRAEHAGFAGANVPADRVVSFPG
jgi:hypothetical protein